MWAWMFESCSRVYPKQLLLLRQLTPWANIYFVQRRSASTEINIFIQPRHKAELRFRVFWWIFGTFWNLNSAFLITERNQQCYPTAWNILKNYRETLAFYIWNCTFHSENWNTIHKSWLDQIILILKFI